MSSKLSVAAVLESLEARAAFHREREAFHAAQEEQHRQERARHAAELETVLHNLEAFRAVSASAMELVQQASSPEPAEPPVKAPASGRLMASRFIRAVVESRTDGEPFGASAVIAEVNRRFGDRLKKPVDTRTASDVLRRMSRERKIHRVRPGKAFAEALYARGARPAS
ncbi:MAG TPA: hypothetical protein VII86_06590 [Thermoanaerobaculia bacterium]